MGRMMAWRQLAVLSVASSLAIGQPAECGRQFAKICQADYAPAMSTMNISLPDPLKSFVDEQVSQRGYGSSSEYVRELIRKDQDRLQLRALLLDGASSAPSATAADDAYFDRLRERARQAAKPC